MPAGGVFLFDQFIQGNIIKFCQLNKIFQLRNGYAPFICLIGLTADADTFRNKLLCIVIFFAKPFQISCKIIKFFHSAPIFLDIIKSVTV